MDHMENVWSVQEEAGSQGAQWQEESKMVKAAAEVRAAEAERAEAARATEAAAKAARVAEAAEEAKAAMETILDLQAMVAQQGGQIKRQQHQLAQMKQLVAKTQVEQLRLGVQLNLQVTDTSLLREARESGLSCGEAKEAGATIWLAKAAGYTLQEVREGGYS